MNDMDNDDAACELVQEYALDAPPEKVWRALSIPELRAQWLQQDEALLATEPRRSQYLRGLAQTDEWVAKANNASFGALAAYDDWVPAFVEIWNQSQRDAAGHAPSASPSPHGWQVFYERVKDLAGLEPGPREQELCRHLPAGSHQPAACKEARSMKRL